MGGKNSKQIVWGGMEWFDLAQDRDIGLSVFYDGVSYYHKMQLNS
jgi:hypothetical protein